MCGRAIGLTVSAVRIVIHVQDRRFVHQRAIGIAEVGVESAGDAIIAVIEVFRLDEKRAGAALECANLEGPTIGLFNRNGAVIRKDDGGRVRRQRCQRSRDSVAAGCAAGVGRLHHRDQLGAIKEQPDTAGINGGVSIYNGGRDGDVIASGCFAVLGRRQ